jgi:hypothetical protein
MVFTPTTDLTKSASTFEEATVSNQKVYVTIRCHNNAGLHTTSTSDGVIISDVPPSADHAVIEIIPQSLTEYSPSHCYHGDKTNLRMKWSGFSDQFGIMSFFVSKL